MDLMEVLRKVIIRTLVFIYMVIIIYATLGVIFSMFNGGDNGINLN